jgi:hypothetical protein
MTRSSLDECLADWSKIDLLRLFERADELERGAPRHLLPGAQPDAAGADGATTTAASTLAAESRRVLRSLAAWRASGRSIDDLVVAWIGPATPDCHAWLEAASILGFPMRLAVPDGHEPDAGLFLTCEGRAPGKIVRVRDEASATRGATLVLTAAEPQVAGASSHPATGLDGALDELSALRRRGRVDFRALTEAVPPPSA